MFEKQVFAATKETCEMRVYVPDIREHIHMIFCNCYACYIGHCCRLFRLVDLLYNILLVGNCVNEFFVHFWLWKILFLLRMVFM